nr:uncharacterized protein LOC131773234 [Pocillopora verrucosa]
MSGQLKNDTGERKLRVTLLSAGWKASSNGDLTTINRELAIQMAKHPNVEVSVFLPQCSEEDKKDADSYNVKLIEAVKLSGFEPVDWLASVPEGHAMDCVLGHGVALGRLIPLIKINPNYSHCKWIQVVHTAPEEIGMYKSISEGQKMQQTEIELCKMADQVVTIGPKLTDAYKHQLRKQDVFNLTPSILSEFSDVQQASDEERTFCVLVTESGDSEDFYVKGYDIAVKAIAELKDKSYQLKFASKQRGKEDELANKLLQCGIGCNQLMICSFDENRETLANLFSAVDIAILPSRTEGFGLSSLQAISAGLPVLVSGNSGIAEALRKVPIGSQCIVDSEDPAEWARAIKAVRYKERNVRLAEARILRENYLQQFSWEKPCNFLVEKMYSLAFDQKLNIKVGVEHIKLADHDAYSTASVSALEPAGYQKASTASGAKRKRQSDTDLEDLELLQKRALSLIAINYINTTPPQSRYERNEFEEYLDKMKVRILDVSVKSLVITVKCESLKSLEELWEDYSCGLLDQIVRDCFVTEKILKELNLAELKLKATMDLEEYNAYKLYFLEKDALKGASSSEFHSISSTSPRKQEELKKWEQKSKIVEREKLKGTSPLTIKPSTGLRKELIEKEQQSKGEQEGTSPSTVLSTAGHKKKWEVRHNTGKFQEKKGMLPLPGSSIFGPEEELVEPRMKLQRIKGALSSEFHSISSTSESPQNQEGSFPVLQFSTIDLEKKLDELSMELQRLRMEGIM